MNIEKQAIELEKAILKGDYIKVEAIKQEIRDYTNRFYLELVVEDLGPGEEKEMQLRINKNGFFVTLTPEQQLEVKRNIELNERCSFRIPF